MGFRGLVENGTEGGCPQVHIVLARAPHGSKDVAAPVGLFADQKGVLVSVTAAGKVVGQLGTGELDRGEGCAEFMRGSRNDAAQISQFLFAGKAICVA